MTASSSQSTLASAAPAEAITPAPTVAEIEASLRLPAGFLIFKGIGWLVVAGVMMLLNASQLTMPGLLAHCPWMTYGRIHPAASTAFIYGFGMQAALGIGIWLLCRLGRTTLVNPVFVFLSAIFWNIGVLVAVVGILAGDNTGFEGFELPTYASPILFFAYSFLAVWVLITFHLRRDREMVV